MSAKPPRIPVEAGFVNERALPRGPNGRALCRRCREEVPRGSRTFCSRACVHEWKIRSQPAYQARELLRRDGGVCAICGLDCDWLANLLHRWPRPRGGARVSHDPMPREEWRALLRGLGFPAGAHWRSRLWDVDHIVPVAEGGGSCGLENLRTLCMPCHCAETAELARRRARARRRQLELPAAEEDRR